jgi:hypothetical protein
MREDTNFTRTENGALTHRSTLNGVLDFFYHAPARRKQDNTGLFLKAFGEDRTYALKALFYVRDVRGGQGERETFRQGMRELYKNFRETFEKVVVHVPVYGRWDDVIEFVDNPVVQGMVRDQLSVDLHGEGDSVSLLAKWMPSNNTSSKKTVALAYKWGKVLGWTPAQYRKNLAALRGKIKLVETAMSQNQWSGIQYGQIPSRAGMIYRDAFKRHDGTRYEAFIQKAIAGEVKVNASTLYPYELMQKVKSANDNTVEALWRNLPNYADTEENALVVADVSGSMMGLPMDVCVSLAIYIAERNKGLFKDKFITFSAAPEIQEIKGKTLYEKVQNLQRAHWDMNTNVQAVFDLLLKTATKNSLPADQMPTKIFIVSDMEFDRCNEGGTNFKAIQKKYEAAGYALPTIVFWNVQSRNDQTPVTQDERGVFLVSGCSPSIFEKAVKAEATTPMQMMLEVLDKPRYEPIVA